jgi:protein-disulfide isomerase
MEDCMNSSLITKLVVCSLVLGASAFALAAEDAAPPQDAKVLRFASRHVPYYPNSTFTVILDKRHPTPSGFYREIEVRRDSASQLLSGVSNFILDEATGNIWVGTVGRLPTGGLDAKSDALKASISSFLPEMLMRNMQLKATVDWNVPQASASTLLPFNLVVDTGYGTYLRFGAVTIDGSLIVMGDLMPFDEDPVAYRKALFESSDFVIWDHRSGSATAAIVEFSDLECPACRVKWPLINSSLKKHGAALDHGMVSYPLPSIHPWAFRAATAAWCVAEQDPVALIGFKEVFYGMQREMENGLVTPTSIDFVLGRDLDEATFRQCYLKAPSLDAVHGQMQFGRSLGISSTPTYFVDGWLVQVPDPSWFEAFVDKIVAGEEP